MKNWCKILIAAFLAAVSLTLSAQDAVLKTNIAYWATGSPNIGAEFALSKKVSLSASAGLQLWKLSDDKQLKHWAVQPELRYWPCEVFNGHVFGFHLLGGQFNMGGVKLPFGIFPSLENNRYQGWAAGAGVSYGYHLLLNRRWSLEFSAGLGYLFIDYKKYKCQQCGKPIKDKSKHYVGPTKLAVSVIYNL